MSGVRAQRIGSWAGALLVRRRKKKAAAITEWKHFIVLIQGERPRLGGSSRPNHKFSKVSVTPYKTNISYNLYLLFI